MNTHFRSALIGGLLVLVACASSACDFPYVPGAGLDHPGDGGTAATAPSAQATPELDSVLLFGTGLLAASGVIRRRWR